jgi:hypothetical protein
MQPTQRPNGSGFNPLLQKPFQKNPPKPKYQTSVPVQPSQPSQIFTNRSEFPPANNQIQQSNFEHNIQTDNYFHSNANGQIKHQQQQQQNPQLVSQSSFFNDHNRPNNIPQLQHQGSGQQHQHHQGNPLRNFNERRSTKELSIQNGENNDRSILHLHPRAPSPPLRFGNNMFENYTLLLNEIKKKDEKIAEVKANIAKIKISSNDQELKHLKTMVETKQRELNQLLQINHNFENEKHTLTQKLAELDVMLQQKLAKQSKTQLFSKSINQLNNELSSLQKEYDSYRTKLNKMDYEAKMEYENQYRELMETKMFAIAMDAAKNNPSPEIQNLYKKLELTQKNKNIAV